MRQIIYIFFLVIHIGFSFSQKNALIDQINKLPKELQADFIHDQVKDLYKKDSALATKELNKALIYFKKNKTVYANLISEKAARLFKIERYEEALLYEKEAHVFFESLNDFESTLHSIRRLSRIYKALNRKEEGIELLFKTLKRVDGDPEKECIILESIGVYFKEMRNTDKALEYLKLAEDRALMVKSTNAGFIKSQLNIDKNLGVLYRDNGDFEKSIFHFNKALAFAESTENVEYRGIVLNSLGILYKQRKEYYKAIKAFEESVLIKQDNDNNAGLSTTFNNLGELYLEINNNLKAEMYMLKAYELAEPLRDRSRLMSACSSLYKLYDRTNKQAKAYPYLQKAFELRDSVYKTSIAEESSRLEAMYDTEKKQREIELSKLQNTQLEESIKAKSRERNIVLGGSGVLLLLLLWSIKSYQDKKKANAELEGKNTLIHHQKVLVEEQHKEILDSITYAKRLQDAILPPRHIVNKQFSDYFIYYQPKGIVAGDFYWMEAFEDVVLICVADCTGHGVPGAMVSLVCSNALNRSVFEFGLKHPGAILDKTRELVLETFSKSSTDVKDGMDISFTSIHRKTNEVKWAGANNPLWYLQNGEFKEITPNKQPIGKVDNYKPFTTHVLHLAKGDSLFLFSDGYADQFGGPKGKKFKYKQFQELLVSGNAKPIAETEAMISKVFDDWKGELEQVDDVCIIGIRL